MQAKQYNINIDLIPINIAIYKPSGDDDWILIYFNDNAENTEKISKESLLGKKVTEVFPGIEEMGLLDVFKRVYESGESELFDITHYQDERISGWRKNTVSKLDENSIITLYEDVSILVELEKQVDEKVIELKKAQKLGKTGSWRYKINEDILTWSDETYNIFQIDKIKHPIKTLNDFFTKVDPKYIEIVNQEYSKHLKDGTPYDIIHELILEDGTSKWIQEKCETIYDDKGKPIESSGILQDITAIHKEKDLLEKMAYIDHLTQIYNRQMFQKFYNKELQNKKRHGDNLSLIMLDIDHFKVLNDTYGHAIGDKVLISLTQLISKHLRTNDIFARWGGEEFLILLPRTNVDVAYDKAQELRKLIEDIKEKIPSFTVSFGVTEVMDYDKELSAFIRVDKALYEAKIKRNDVVLL